jgi:hypothetical protein
LGLKRPATGSFDAVVDLFYARSDGLLTGSVFHGAVDDGADRRCNESPPTPGLHLLDAEVDGSVFHAANLRIPEIELRRKLR